MISLGESTTNSFASASMNQSGAFTPGGATPNHSGVWDNSGSRTPTDARNGSRTPPGNRTPPGTPNTSGVFTPKDGSTPPVGGSRTPKGGWQTNTSACGVCCLPFGKIGRRHHCRLCGLCVCHPCSPSTVHVEGSKGMHRACHQCVGIAAKANQLVDRVADLSRHLNEAQEPQFPAVVKAVTLDDAVDVLEHAMKSICASRIAAAESLQNVNARLLATAQEEKDSEVVDTPGQVEAAPLDEVVDATDLAAGLVEARLKQLQEKVAAEKKLRMQLEAKADEAESSLQRKRKGDNSPRSTTTAQTDKASLGKCSLGSESQRGARIGKCLSRRGSNHSASWA